MDHVLISGYSEHESERFEFRIGTWAQRIGLIVRRTSPIRSWEAGAGLWDSVEKAMAIAQDMVHQAFGSSCEIIWTDFAHETDVRIN